MRDNKLNCKIETRKFAYVHENQVVWRAEIEMMNHVEMMDDF